MSPALYAQNAGAPGAAFQPPQKPPLAKVEGKTAYVTGASSGIGLGIARACYDAGMNVIIGYIDERQVDEALSFFADRSRVMAIRHDVTDRPGWDRLVVEAEKRFRRVHLLVNNAGVGLFATVSKGSFNDFDWGMAVNVTGVFNGIHTFVPRMLEYGEGAHIATTSSMSGILPGATAGIYTTSKFATCGMMEALRVELQATNIGTSVFLPGGVNTNIRDTERNRPEQFRNPSAGAAPAANGDAAAWCGHRWRTTRCTALGQRPVRRHVRRDGSAGGRPQRAAWRASQRPVHLFPPRVQGRHARALRRGAGLVPGRAQRSAGTPGNGASDHARAAVRGGDRAAAGRSGRAAAQGLRQRKRAAELPPPPGQLPEVTVIFVRSRTFTPRK